MIIESLLVILLIPLAGTGIDDIGDTFVRIFVLICTKLRFRGLSNRIFVLICTKLRFRGLSNRIFVLICTKLRIESVIFSLLSSFVQAVTLQQVLGCPQQPATTN